MRLRLPPPRATSRSARTAPSPRTARTAPRARARRVLRRLGALPRPAQVRRAVRRRRGAEPRVDVRLARERRERRLTREEPLDAAIAASGHGNAKLWLSYSASYDESTGLATNRTAELFVNPADNRDALDAKGFSLRESRGRRRRHRQVVLRPRRDGRRVRPHPERGFRCDGPRRRDCTPRRRPRRGEFPSSIASAPSPCARTPRTAARRGSTATRSTTTPGATAAPARASRGGSRWPSARALVRVYTRHAEVRRGSAGARGARAGRARRREGRREGGPRGGEERGDRLAETLETFTTPVSQPRGQGEDDANARLSKDWEKDSAAAEPSEESAKR